MAILIEDPDVVLRIERLAARLQVSPVQAVGTAVREKAARQDSEGPVDQATRERRLRAMAEAQEWFRLHGDKDPEHRMRLSVTTSMDCLADGRRFVSYDRHSEV